jgi:hypothetical protein
VRGGPRRAPGAPVHSGPHRRGIPLFDWRRRSAIQQPRTRASGSGGGVSRRAAVRSRGSPASPLDSAPGHHLVHELVHFVVEVRAHVVGGLGGDRASSAAGTGMGRRGRSSELVSGPRCTRRREFERGLLLTVRRRSKRARKRRGCAGGDAWQRRRIGAALRCGRGVAPTGAGDEILW